MPGIDNTGPLGNGPIGRGMGPCGSGSSELGRGRGFRRGGGGGWGSRRGALSPEEEKIFLEQKKEWLSNMLAAINQRLQDLGEQK